jgi:hypothetical protein
MKYIKYMSYIVRHKYYVFAAGLKTRAPIINLIIHDWSKLLPSEWIPYMEHFYGQGSIKFKYAWLQHLNRNKHHWQYWVLHEDSGNIYALDMPDKYIKEMVADWAGAGRAITGRWEVFEWYHKNKLRMTLSPVTRLKVEAELSYLSKLPLFK